MQLRDQRGRVADAVLFAEFLGPAKKRFHAKDAAHATRPRRTVGDADDGGGILLFQRGLQIFQLRTGLADEQVGDFDQTGARAAGKFDEPFQIDQFRSCRLRDRQAGRLSDGWQPGRLPH